MALRLRDILSGQPYPSRGAVVALRERVIRYLSDERPTPGTPLATDAQLVRYSSLSRSTVRRALGELQRDGWVLREVGRGTFVGPKVGVMPTQTELAPADEHHDVGEGDPTLAEPAIRMGVMIFDIANLTGDWFTPSVLQGIDRGADRHDVRVELIGATEGDTEAIARRLRQSRPDVLACLANDLRHLLVLRDAQQMRIPVMVAGTPFASVGFPAVTEDNEQGIRLAVKHLRGKGHRDPALLMYAFAGGWVTERHFGYTDALQQAGERPRVHWVHTQHSQVNPELWRDDLDRLVGDTVSWLQHNRPTSVISGNFVCTEVLGLALDELGWRAGREVSVVAFDQHPANERWLHVPPTVMALPLRDIGSWLATQARAMVAGHSPSGCARLPIHLVEGKSVQTLR